MKSTHDLDLANRRNWFLQNESPADIQLILTDHTISNLSFFKLQDQL